MKKPFRQNYFTLIDLLILMLFVGAGILHASDLRVGKLYLHFKGEEKLIEVVEFEDIMLSKNCFKAGLEAPHCKAFEATKTPERLKETKEKPSVGNPAAHYCEQKGGTNLILRDKKENQYSFCYFKADASFVDSWQLLERAEKDLEEKREAK